MKAPTQLYIFQRTLSVKGQPPPTAKLPKPPNVTAHPCQHKGRHVLVMPNLPTASLFMSGVRGMRWHHTLRTPRGPKHGAGGVHSTTAAQPSAQAACQSQRPSHPAAPHPPCARHARMAMAHTQATTAQPKAHNTGTGQARARGEVHKATLIRKEQEHNLIGTIAGPSIHPYIHPTAAAPALAAWRRQLPAGLHMCMCHATQGHAHEGRRQQATPRIARHLEALTSPGWGWRLASQAAL